MTDNAETAPEMRFVRIIRRYAEVREDAIRVIVPEDISDDEVDGWAEEHSEEFYTAVIGKALCAPGEILWEDEHYSDDTGIDDEWLIGEIEAEVQHNDGSPT